MIFFTRKKPTERELLNAISSRLDAINTEIFGPSGRASVRLLLERILAEQQELRKDMQKIMATADEVAAQINALTQTIGEIRTTVDKVGTETEGLKQKIADLEAAINAAEVPDSVTDALAALQESFGGLAASVAAVDDKVPDAPTA